MKFSSSDKPVQEPCQDIFGYAHFSKTLADSLTKLEAVEGLVISINGPWGTGKTSVINFIKYYLNEEPEENRPYIINFNPWLFTGQEDLIQSFLEEMLSEIAPYTELHDKLKNDLSTLAGIFSKGSKLIPIAGDAISAITEIAKDQLQKRPSLQKTKNKVAELLSQEKRNIVIFIDDIDRLSSLEIRHLFGAIKSIANFPNVLYILAFDEEVVSNALSKTQDMDGMAYIEKIVQMPFKLPLPDRDSLYNFLCSNIDILVKNTDQAYIDVKRWQHFYGGMFINYLRTPRTIVRLLNTLRVTYPVIENEVNFVDFVAIEILRIFVPLAYETIRTEEERFLLDKSAIGLMMQFKTDEIRGFHNSWMSVLDKNDIDAVKYCINNLFPNVAKVLSENEPSHESAEWRKNLRICAREHFHKYFKLSVPSCEINNTSFQQFLSRLQDSIYIATTLQTMLEEKMPDGISKTARYLSKLLDHMEEFQADKAKGLMEAIFNVGDIINIDTDHDKSFIGFGTSERISWILYGCCEKMNNAEREEIHLNAYAKYNGLSTKILWLSNRLDDYDDEKKNKSHSSKEPLLSKELLEKLKELIVPHIKSAAEDLSLLEKKYFSLILSEWSKISGPNGVNAFVEKVLADDYCTLKFIKAFSSFTRTGHEGAVIAKNILRIRLDWMKDFVEIERVYNKAVSITAIPDDNDSELNRCYEQFMKEYKAFKEGRSLKEW